MYMCVCMHSSGIYMCVFGCPCGGQKSMPGVFLCHSSHFYFLRQSLSLNLESTSLAGLVGWLLSSEHKGSSCHYLFPQPLWWAQLLDSCHSLLGCWWSKLNFSSFYGSCGVYSFLPQCELWGSNSDCQAYWQVPLPTGLPPQPSSVCCCLFGGGALRGKYLAYSPSREARGGTWRSCWRTDRPWRGCSLGCSP